MERSRQDRDGTQSTQISPQQREALREGARELTGRDAPDGGAGHKGGRGSAARDEVYRPEANVDDQKHSAKKPGIDTRRETTPVGGAQVVRDKGSHKENINDQAEKARSSRRNG